MNRKRPIYIMLYRPEVEKTTILEGNKISRFKENITWLIWGVTSRDWLSRKEWYAGCRYDHTREWKARLLHLFIRTKDSRDQQQQTTSSWVLLNKQFSSKKNSNTIIIIWSLETGLNWFEPRNRISDVRKSYLIQFRSRTSSLKQVLRHHVTILISRDKLQNVLLKSEVGNSLLNI